MHEHSTSESYSDVVALPNIGGADTMKFDLEFQKLSTSKQWSGL